MTRSLTSIAASISASTRSGRLSATDADRPRYIETIPRRGYRFIANIEGNGKVEQDPSNFSVSIAPPSRDNESDKQQTPPPAPLLTKRKILVGSLGLLAAIVTVLLV